MPCGWWRGPTAASSAALTSASTSPRSTASKAGCWLTCRPSPTRSTPASAPDHETRAVTSSPDRAVAIVGVGAILPDAPDAAAFWRNLTEGRYSIGDVDPARWDPALYYDPDPKARD